MKKAILIVMALVLILFLLPSCGVPKKEYDKINSDLAAAQAQVQSLRNDLTAKEGELTTAQAQIQSLQGDLSAKESELEAAKVKLEQGKAMIELLNAIFIPALKGETMTEAETMNLFLAWRDKVNAIGDPELTAKFQALIDSGGSNEATTGFFLYLFESLPKTLE